MSFWPTVFAMCMISLCTSPTVAGRKDSAATSINRLCLKPECIETAARILRHMNSRIDPCTDFYEFACGNYAKPESEPVGDESITSKQEVDSRLHRIIEDIDAHVAPKVFRELQNSYRDCMRTHDWKADEEARLEASRNIQDIVNEWKIISNTQWNQTDLNHLAVNSYLFQAPMMMDATNYGYLIPELTIRQPFIAWKHLKGSESNKVVQAYLDYVSDVSMHLNLSDYLDLSERNALTLFELELADIVVPKDENYDIRYRYRKTTVGELESRYPELYLKEFLRKDNSRKVQMKMDENVLERLQRWKLSKSRKALVNWVTWRWTLSRVHELGPYFAYRTKILWYDLYGTEKKEDKWRRCLGQVRKEYPFILDVLYYGQHVSNSLVTDTLMMFSRIRTQFTAIIRKAKWLDIATQDHAVKKIRNVTHNLGIYENLMLDKISNPSFFDVKLSDGLLVDNRANITQLLIQSDYLSRINENDMKKFAFVESDAEYYHYSRFLNVGARGYTEPYYNIGRPKALNYGAFGFVLSHELAHSLDDNNRHVDKNGNLNPWWDSQSNKTFVERVQCLVQQYKKYGHEEFGFYLNSFESRNEDIADLVGVKIAYSAYDKWAKEHRPEKQLPGLDYSSKQMFWISYAHSQCSAYEKKAFATTFTSSEYSPAKLRVNMPLSNMPEFSEDFTCQTSSKMNLVEKCTVW